MGMALDFLLPMNPVPEGPKVSLQNRCLWAKVLFIRNITALSIRPRRLFKLYTQRHTFLQVKVSWEKLPGSRAKCFAPLVLLSRMDQVLKSISIEFICHLRLLIWSWETPHNAAVLKSIQSKPVFAVFVGFMSQNRETEFLLIRLSKILSNLLHVIPVPNAWEPDSLTKVTSLEGFFNKTLLAKDTTDGWDNQVTCDVKCYQSIWSPLKIDLFFDPWILSRNPFGRGNMVLIFSQPATRILDQKCVVISVILLNGTGYKKSEEETAEQFLAFKFMLKQRMWWLQHIKFYLHL